MCGAAMRAHVRGVVRGLWMRGFLPAAIVLLLGLFSAGSWILWTARGSVAPRNAPPRAVLGKGVLLVNWGWPGKQRWVGGHHWHLGVMTDGAGKVRSGISSHARSGPRAG